MLTTEFLNSVYKNNTCDFFNKTDCEKHRKETEDLGNGSPLFTFVMPTYNDITLLNASINSLLNQSYKDWELIIIDNSTSTDKIWELIENAQASDPRIKGKRNSMNVGWPKAMAMGIAMAAGTYITLLAADDFIMPDALEKMRAILEKEQPDILFVGHGYTQFQNENVSVLGEIAPKRRIYNNHNKSETIIEILATDIYYNSLFHYLKTDFLKNEGIDFFEPWYADCGGMTRAMAKAGKIAVLDEIIYLLTQNTSQTVGKYTINTCINVYGRQWQDIKEVFDAEQYHNNMHKGYVSFRIMNNMLGCFGALCQNKCRDIYMNPVSLSAADITMEVEDILSDKNILEMFYRDDEYLFPVLLEKLNLLDGEIQTYIKTSQSYLYPLVMLGQYYKKDINRDDLFKLVLAWMMEEKNTHCIGYHYLLDVAGNVSDDVLEKYGNVLKGILDKYEDITKK